MKACVSLVVCLIGAAAPAAVSAQPQPLTIDQVVNEAVERICR